MKKTKVIPLTPRRRAKVIPLAPRRREAMDLVKFIDAHGGRLGAFRGYGAAQRQVSPSASPTEPM